MRRSELRRGSPESDNGVSGKTGAVQRSALASSWQSIGIASSGTSDLSPPVNASGRRYGDSCPPPQRDLVRVVSEVSSYHHFH